MKQKRDDIEKEEHAQILRQIETEFDKETERVTEQKKVLAQQN